MRARRHHQSETQDDTIAVARYENEMEAKMAVEFLERNRIKSYVLREDPAGMGLFRGASVMVSKRDFEKAERLLNG